MYTYLYYKCYDNIISFDSIRHYHNIIIISPVGGETLFENKHFTPSLAIIWAAGGDIV